MALKKGGSFIFDIDSMYKMETILKDYDEENEKMIFIFIGMLIVSVKDM